MGLRRRRTSRARRRRRRGRGRRPDPHPRRPWPTGSRRTSPTPAMLEELARRVPEARTVRSPAETLPVDDASLDAVLAAQAWHWFDHAAAAAEFRRVLRPGGVIGLLWNVRDTRVSWMADLQDIIGRRGLDAHGGRVVARPLGAGRHRGDPRVPPRRRAGVLPPHGGGDARAGCSTWCRRTPTSASRRDADELYAAVRELLATHPETAGRDVIEMPYVTAAYRAVRTG